ncbi:uncharacterized protein LOC144093484 [Amblyomma americanum]
MVARAYSTSDTALADVNSEANDVEEEHIQQLARFLHPFQLQPQQDDPVDQSTLTQQRNVSVMQPFPVSMEVMPQSLMQPQTPAGHVHQSSAGMITGVRSTSKFASSSMIPSTSGLPMTPTTPALADPGIFPQIQNVVSTVNLGCRLNLKAIALRAWNVKYNPDHCRALIMRIREPRTTASIFSSGKMVCAGAKSEEESRLAARKYARIIQKLGFEAKFLDFRICTIVASCDVHFALRLEGLVVTHSEFSSYEPQLYPGLIFKMKKPRIALLIFPSGKVLLTGAKVTSEIYEAFNYIYPVLKGVGIHK